jgi:hypothetical protein
MAQSQWLVIDEVWCDRVQAPAELLEERVYPADVVPEAALTYQVRARKCAFGVDCNLAGYTCRYAFNNPN